jgi:SAM-dependent methyltransferase
VSDLYDDLADLYDAVFDWDVEDEADWLVERLGQGCRRVLEPGCGAGRMFAPLAARGLIVTGIDRSAAMAERARARNAGRVVLGDMTDFDLGACFDGAICPINTLGHLSHDEVALHLRAMARALEPGSRYLVQLALDADVGDASRWEVDRDGVRIRATWTVESRDAERGTELHRSIFEVVAGPRAGEVHDQLHQMSFWTADTWGAAVAASAFDWVAVYEGSEPGRPRVDFTATGGLLWHELVRR